MIITNNMTALQLQKVSWYLNRDYLTKNEYTISNELISVNFVLEKRGVSCNEISTALKKINNEPQDPHFQFHFQIPIYTIWDCHDISNELKDYKINTVICKKGDEYFLKYEFDGIDNSRYLDSRVNKLLPAYPIDKTKIVNILTEILEHQAKFDVEKFDELMFS